MILMLAFILFFTIIWDILATDFGFNEEDNMGDNNGGRFIRLYIRAFRNSIGDLLSPMYGSEFNHPDPSVSVKIYIWLIWLMNVLFIFVIFQNFLVGYIMQTFSAVNE